MVGRRAQDVGDVVVDFERVLDRQRVHVDPPATHAQVAAQRGCAQDLAIRERHRRVIHGEVRRRDAQEARQEPRLGRRLLLGLLQHHVDPVDFESDTVYAINALDTDAFYPGPSTKANASTHTNSYTNATAIKRNCLQCPERG